MTTHPILYRKNLLLFLSTWLYWSVICVAGLHFLYDLGWKEAVLDSLVSNVLLAVGVLFIANTLSYYNPRNNTYTSTLVGSAVLALLWLLADQWVLKTVIASQQYAGFLSQSAPIRFIIAYLVNVGFCVSGLLWYHLEEEQETQQRREEAEKMNREAELYKLRQQLHPHFLFNSLNSINALIATKPEQARQMVQQLSDFLRGTIRREENEWIPLEEELGNLRLYLEIEKVRFGHRLMTEMEVADESLPARIPALILQPLMENAIKFGLYGTTGEVHIYLRTLKKDGYLLVSISNPYDPDMQMPEGTGFGLKSVKRRLSLLFARNDLVEINKTAGSFVVTLRIPVIVQEKQDNDPKDA